MQEQGNHRIVPSSIVTNDGNYRWDKSITKVEAAVSHSPALSLVKGCEGTVQLGQVEMAEDLLSVFLLITRDIT
jgi:hypothetical protein